MILKLALNLLAPLHVMWTCLSPTHQIVWKIDIIGMLVAGVAQGVVERAVFGNWKDISWGRWQNSIFALTCYVCSKIRSRKVPLEWPFWQGYLTWVEQSQLRWLGEIGLSVMCSTSDVILCVKKGKWVSSFLHIFPGSAFEQLNPMGWRSQRIPPSMAVSSCSISLFPCPDSSKANHKLRRRVYTWPAMNRLACWVDRWPHKHREDKHQPDCISRDQCSGKTLRQGSL